MKYFLHGDDSLAIRLRKRELTSSFQEKNPGGQIQIFTFPEALLANALEEETSPSLFEAPKLFIFEETSLGYDAAPERIKNLLALETGNDCLFIEYKKIPKANSFLKIIQKKVDAEELYESKKRDISALVSDLEEELQLGALEGRTKSILRERSGNDDDLYLQNIRKVLTYSEGKAISSEELTSLTPVTLETKVFEALDLLVSGQKEKANVLFQKILRDEDIFRIFPLCAWQIRQMLLVTEAQENFPGNKEKIAKSTSIHPFVVQKILRVLPSFPRARLSKGLKILSAVDVDIKQGRRTPEGALHHFLFQW